MSEPKPLLLFDFWGVIGLVQPDGDVQGMADCMGVPVERFRSAYWAERHAYDAGELAADYWARVAAAAGAALTPDLLAELVERDTGSWRRLDDEMVALLHELQALGYRMALLSNAPRELAGWVRASAAAPYLSPLLFSCEVGLAKPDAAIYLLAVELLELPAAQVVFIDDRAVNVEAAQQLGLQGIVHTSVAETRARLLA